MSKIKYVVLFIALFFTVVACTTYTMSIDSSDSKHVDISYKSFNGTTNYKLKFDNTKENNLIVNVTTNSGDLDVTIKDENGKVLYEGNKLTTSSFSVRVEGSKSYTITTKGTKHSGGITIKPE